MVNKIIPRNLTARSAYNVAGNPPSTRLESGVGNCYPGLEYDHRNLDRRFFPGLVFEFLSQEDAESPSAARAGGRLREVDTTDPELRTVDARYAQRAAQLRSALSGDVGSALTSASSTWFLKSISQGGKTIEMSRGDGTPLDGLTVWRLVRSLRPDAVTLILERRMPASVPGGSSAPAPQQVTLEGWRRRYTDATTGVISPSFQPGELTQSLCSPWMHDFRDCGCTYWASNHPDIVFAEALPGDTLLPAGDPEDPVRGVTRVDWLRSERAWSLTSAASASNAGNYPLQISHFEINRRWQDLAIVLEDREIGSIYVPRSRMADNARPYGSPTELRDALIGLAGLEHLVALLYLYGRYSIISRQQAEAQSTPNGPWPDLADDVEFSRHQLLLVAVGEMQHLRWVNHLLFGLSGSGLIPGWKYEPSVLKPALQIPSAGRVKGQPAVLAPLDPKTLQLFADIEEPSGYIDGRYARVTATFLQPIYPRHLHEMASTIVRDGEQHYLHFRDIQRVLAQYGDGRIYLRPIKPGDPTLSEVKEALDTYQQILKFLFAGYEMSDITNMQNLAEARQLMFVLDDKAEALAQKNIGVPFLSLFDSPRTDP